MTRGSVAVAAVDLGASSGRVVLGHVGPHQIRIETVTRFANEPVMLPDGLHWNLPELYLRSLEGLRAAGARAGSRLTGIALDSWAVDYGLLRDDRLLGLPFHYRDGRTSEGVRSVHARVPFQELYARNGLQLLPFNTVYQLAADSWAAEAERLLLIPDLLGWWLTGKQVAERTNASTTGLVDVRTGEWDLDLTDRLRLSSRLLPPLVDPGTTLGTLLPAVVEQTGLAGVPVTTVGSHDTASAVVGVPLSDPDAAYISCGTWGLIGLELERPVLTDAAREANFTNERGVDGRTRFLTNVMGLWLLSESLRAWERQGLSEDLTSLLAAAAALSPTRQTFDVQDPTFLAPGDMPARIVTWYDDAGYPPPSSRPGLVRAVVDSLAQAFADGVERASRLAAREIRVVHLVGGGALNRLLCQATADRCGRPVVAGPVEATALGNVLIQGRTAGAVRGDLDSLRAVVRATIELETYAPRAGVAA